MATFNYSFWRRGVGADASHRKEAATIGSPIEKPEKWAERWGQRVQRKPALLSEATLDLFRSPGERGMGGAKGIALLAQTSSRPGKLYPTAETLPKTIANYQKW